MTTGERTARIDREFDRSFGVFDGRIRDEQAVIAGQRGGRGGTGTGQGSGNDASGGGESGGDANDGNGEGSAGAPGGKDGKGGGSQGGEGQTGERGNGQTGGGGYGGGAKGGGGPTTAPADIPDGSDDDVVARQLREAATNETDAELREKLWQEYRNYKKGAG